MLTTQTQADTVAEVYTFSQKLPILDQYTQRICGACGKVITPDIDCEICNNYPRLPRTDLIQNFNKEKHSA